MGGHLPKPITTKEHQSGQGNGLTWNCCSMQGWRMDMEDAHITKAVLSDRLSNYSLFAVFDGHAGKEVANLTSLEFTNHLLTISPFDKLNNEDEYKQQEIIKALHQAFQTWDVKLRTHPHLLKLNDRSGSTATGVLITPRHYFVFNVGDSRTILIRNKQLEFATDDHKPMNDGERKRIEGAGGRVIINRINGSLAVSRALGDFDYKANPSQGNLEQLVSPDPCVTCIDRDDEDNYLLVACDGIYDFLPNQDIVDYINERFTSEEHERDIVSNLIDLALYKNSKDNMSAVVISFDKGKIAQDAEKVAKDKEYNELLRFYIKDYISRRKAETAQSIIPKEELLESIQNDPTLTSSCTSNTGLVAKQGVIEKYYELYLNDDTS